MNGLETLSVIAVSGESDLTIGITGVSGFIVLCALNVVLWRLMKTVGMGHQSGFQLIPARTAIVPPHGMRPRETLVDCTPGYHRSNNSISERVITYTVTRLLGIRIDRSGAQCSDQAGVKGFEEFCQ